MILITLSMMILQTIQGFAPSTAKLLATVALVLLTGGLFLILLTWRSDIKLNCTQRRVPLREARRVLLKDKFEQVGGRSACFCPPVR